MSGGSDTAASDDEPVEATLTFHEQADGRKVARLPGGKVVLLDSQQVHRVANGERWLVRLRHRETFAIADPVDLAREPLLSNPVLPTGFSIPARPPSPAAVESAAGGRSPGDAGPTVIQPAPGGQSTPAAARSPGRSPLPSTPMLKSALAATAAGAQSPADALLPDRIVRPADRVALFIDGANMDGASRSAGFFVDYRKAREFFLAGGMYYAGFYYIADFTASDPLQQRYLDFLSHAGYIVRRRPVKVIRDQDTGERIIKGNLDTEIVLDMVNTVGNYDVAFLFSGDSDFERAVDLLRSRGKRVYLVTARSTLSRELSYVADKPIFFIEDYRAHLIRTERGPIERDATGSGSKA